MAGGGGDGKHAYKIMCTVCDEEISSGCIMELLEFIVKHKECLLGNGD